MNVNVYFELKNSPTWDKCHVKDSKEIYEFATDEEKDVLSKMTDCIVNCHSVQCDAGGKCDIVSKFHILTETKFDRSQVTKIYKKMKNELPSLENFIAVQEQDGNLGIRAEADERELERWLTGHVVEKS